MKISVVIQFLNSLRYLPEAVASVRSQSFTDWELVLVDGGSTDGSTELARQYERESGGQIRVLVHPGPGTLGIYSSRVWGAREAKAPLLALLDSDDIWHPRFLERQYSMYRALLGERDGMLYCPMYYWWQDSREALRGFVQTAPPSGLHEAPGWLFHAFKQGLIRTPGNSGIMVARKIVVEAGALIGTANEGSTEDQFLFAFVGLHYPVAYNPEPLVWYRQWPGSTCALQTEKGGHAFEAHHRWFIDYVTREYHGPGKEALLREARGWLREVTHPPGPVRRRLRRWRAGLARRLAN